MRRKMRRKKKPWTHPPNRIAEWREAKGLTQFQLAALLKPKPTTGVHISRLETGIRGLSHRMMVRIAKALDIYPSDLLPTGQVRPADDTLDESLHDLAKRITLNAGFPYTDPRTRKTTRPGTLEPHQRLRAARIKAGYASATAAAQAMGVRPSTYMGHENGTTPYTRQVLRYATAFHCSTDYLLKGKL